GCHMLAVHPLRQGLPEPLVCQHHQHQRCCLTGPPVTSRGICSMELPCQTGGSRVWRVADVRRPLISLCTAHLLLPPTPQPRPLTLHNTGEEAKHEKVHKESAALSRVMWARPAGQTIGGD
ncbi:unnamed protein product, partial [Pleuronectes platessa]